MNIKKVICLILLTISCSTLVAQEWLTSMSVAKRLALTQNKLLLVVWDDSASFPLPTEVFDANGRRYFFPDLFESEELNEIVWRFFIPVFVNEASYDDWFDTIKNKRSFEYLEKFRDDTVKIMDINGNMLSLVDLPHNPLNFSLFIQLYGMDTSFMNQELRAYKKSKTFYSAFYLGAKYVDYAVSANLLSRQELVLLSEIYFEEAEDFLDILEEEEKKVADERLDLIRIKQDLLLNNPDRVIRKLKRFDKPGTAEVNKQLVAFLYYTAYKMKGQEGNARLWEDKVSAINMKKAELILEKSK